MFVRFTTTKNEDLIINTNNVYVISGTKQEGVYRIFFDSGDYYDVKTDYDSITCCLRFLNDSATFYSVDKLKK